MVFMFATRRKQRLSSLLVGMVLILGTSMAPAETNRSVVYQLAEGNADLRGRFLNRKVALQDFLPQMDTRHLILTNQLSFTCSQQVGLVSENHYSDIAKFLRNALVNELIQLEVFEHDAPTRVSGNLAEVNAYLSQHSFPGSAYLGSWEFTLRLRSSLGKSFDFKSTHSFSIDRSSEYCEEMIDEFVPGVHVLIRSILESEQFYSLITS